jgi:hypothetical protein
MFSSTFASVAATSPRADVKLTAPSVTVVSPASPDTSAMVAAAVLAQAGHHDEAASILERANGMLVPAISSWGALAALIVGRLDLATQQARDYLQRGLGVTSHDTNFGATIAALCHRLGKEDLAALWAAATLGQERRLPTHGALPPSSGLRALRQRLGTEIDPAITEARDRLGDRFEELVRHYETTSDPGPIRDTITVLDSHASDLAATVAR